MSLAPSPRISLNPMYAALDPLIPSESTSNCLFCASTRARSLAPSAFMFVFSVPSKSSTYAATTFEGWNAGPQLLPDNASTSCSSRRDAEASQAPRELGLWEIPRGLTGRRVGKTYSQLQGLQGCILPNTFAEGLYCFCRKIHPSYHDVDWPKRFSYQ